VPLEKDLAYMADGKVVSALIDRQEWLEPVADKMQGAIEAAYDAAGPAKKPIENALNGVWLGHVLHPVVVTVPVGAWTVTAVLDVLEGAGKDEYAAGADASLAIGLAGAAGAAVTGMTQWYPVKNESVKKLGATHANPQHYSDRSLRILVCGAQAGKSRRGASAELPGIWAGDGKLVSWRRAFL
jgi:cytochrome bd-type quinol oxidase subunit 1